MDTSKIIKGVVNSGRYTVTAPIVKEDYGLYLKIEGVELPETYQVDFSNSENDGTSVTMIGNADGVHIPNQFVKSGKDIFAFLYHVGQDFGRTVYKFRIPNKVRPDRTNEEPTPEEQSVIDQTISALNDAVEDAQDAQQAIENMSVSAQTLAEGSSATVTKTESDGVVHLEFGIPRGATGAQGERGEKGDKGDTGAQGIKGDKGDTGAQGIQGEKGEKGDKGDKGDTGEVTQAEFDELSGEVSDLKEELSSKIGLLVEDTSVPVVIGTKESGTDTLPDGFSHTLGYLRGMGISNPGNLAGTTSTVSNTFYVQIEEDADVWLVCSNGASRRLGLFEGSPYGEANRVSPIYASNNANYPMPTQESPLHVTAGQYVTFSWYNGTALTNGVFTLYKVGAGGAVIKPTLPLTDTQKEEVQTAIDTARENLYCGDGWEYLPENGFSVGEWTAWNTKGSRAFRVRYNNTLLFDRDVNIRCELGFYIAGYYETGSLVALSSIRLPANTKLQIYVRRIVEDATETATVSEFSKAVRISTSIADIERLVSTFTDISMFERVGIGGDSYAAGGGIISGIRPLTWGKNLERQAGITVDIYAKSGQTVVQWVNDSTNGLPALLAGNECGLYWLAHGINGTATAEELGTPADMSASPRPATFYGQYVEAIKQIQSVFPNARIVVQTICGSSYKLYQTIYADVNTAIRAIAEYCEVPVIDVIDDDYYKSGWYSVYCRSNHPTAMVAAGMAHANRRLIAKCILENPSYFINYGT